VKLAIFYDHVLEAASQKGISVREVLKRAKSFGYDSLECSMESISANPELTREMFDSVGMSVAGIYKYFNLGNDPLNDGPASLINMAVYYKADSVLVNPGFVSREVDERAMTRRVGTSQMQNMAYAMRNIVQYADKWGVKVTMEDLDDAAAPYASDVQLEWFVQNVPGLGICFDTGNFMYADVDEREAFIRLRNNICHLHLKDRALHGAPGEEPKVSVTGVNMFSAPVGGGVLHIREILEELKAMGYDGTLAVEHFGAPDMLDYMEKSAKYVRNIWNN